VSDVSLRRRTEDSVPATAVPEPEHGEVPELRDVPGPSALGGGWVRARDLLYLLAITDFKKTYFGTALGYLWSLARPLMLFAVLLAVFTQVFRIGSQVPHYPVLLLLNIVLFGFFQEATLMAVSSIVSQESVVRKTQFPRLVIPLSVVLTAFFNLALNLVVVFVFVLAFGVDPQWTWLLFPVVLTLLVTITSAVSMIVAALYPRFRDLAIIWTVFSTVLFYASPVLYPIDKVPATMQDILSLNPLTPLLELARKWIIDPSAPGPVAVAGVVLGVIVPLVIYVGLCVLAVWILNREAPRIAEEL
jgi:ABC-2 type transport system permease protein